MSKFDFLTRSHGSKNGIYYYEGYKREIKKERSEIINRSCYENLSEKFG